jgi:hypothetical protein
MTLPQIALLLEILDRIEAKIDRHLEEMAKQ